MPKGESKNITNISGKLRNNTLMYGRVVNGQQFISTVKNGWTDNPTDDQKKQRVRWRIYQFMWPLIWGWLQGDEYMREFYPEAQRNKILYALTNDFKNGEDGEIDNDIDFRAQLRFSWKHEDLYNGVVGFSQSNPPDGGIIQWMFQKMEDGEFTYREEKYKSIKMLAKAYFWYQFVSKLQKRPRPGNYENWRGKFQALGFDWYEITPEGYDQMVIDLTPRGMFLRKDSDDDSGGSTPPGEGEEGGQDTPPGGGGGQEPDPPDTPEEPDPPVNPEEPEDPDRTINEYLERADWLVGDGSHYISSYRPIAGSNTNKAPDITIKAKIRVSKFASTVGTVTNICGSSIVSDGVRFRKSNLAIRAKSAYTFEVGYFAAVANIAEDLKYYGEFSMNDVLTIEATAQKMIINGKAYTLENEQDNNLGLVDLIVLYAGSSNGGRSYGGELAYIEYWSKGVCNSQLVPCKVTKVLPASMANTATAQPVGAVGLWDTKNEKFMTSSAANTWQAIND